MSHYFTRNSKSQNINNYKQCTSWKQKYEMIPKLTTQQAIIVYKSLPHGVQRDYLFQRCIYNSFLKLSQVIINKKRAYNFDISFQSVKMQVTCHLMTKIDNFDETKGKALSYFTSIAQNYVLYWRHQNFKKLIATQRLQQDNEVDILTSQSGQISSKFYKEVNQIQKQQQLNDIFRITIMECKQQFDNIFKKQNQRQIAYKVIQFMENYKDLVQNYRYSHIYKALRDYTNMPSSKLTVILKKIKIKYYKIKQQYINHKFLMIKE